jgi:hypothetical protein
MNELEFLRQQLADKNAGVPSHTHRDTAGEPWICTSPYCDRGNDVRDDPQPGPQETKEFAEIRYRRGNA